MTIELLLNDRQPSLKLRLTEQDLQDLHDRQPSLKLRLTEQDLQDLRDLRAQRAKACPEGRDLGFNETLF